MKKQTVLLLSTLCCYTLLHAMHDVDNPLQELNGDRQTVHHRLGQAPASSQEVTIPVSLNDLQLIQTTLNDLVAHTKQQKEEIEKHKQDKKELVYILGPCIPGAFVAGAATATCAPHIIEKIREQIKNHDSSLRIGIIPIIIKKLLHDAQLTKHVTFTLSTIQDEIGSDEAVHILYCMVNNPSQHPAQHLSEALLYKAKIQQFIPPADQQKDTILIPGPNGSIILRKAQLENATYRSVLNRLAGYLREKSGIQHQASQPLPLKQELAKNIGAEIGYNTCVQFIHCAAKKSGAKNDALEELLPQDCQPKDMTSLIVKLAVQYGLQQGAAIAAPLALHLASKCIQRVLFSNLMPTQLY